MQGSEKHQARIVAVNVSKNKGERKTAVTTVDLVADHGIAGDAHAGNWHRQVSLLAEESIASMQRLGLKVGAGDFAENITTSGIDLVALPVGTKMMIGEALAEVTQIGKECHAPCAIYHQAGSCVMPKEGIFVRVLEGGRAETGSPLVILNPDQGVK